MEEEAWPEGVSSQMVAYIKELAISSDQARHWADFFTNHAHGRLAWKEIRRLWKPSRRRRKKRRTS